MNIVFILFFTLFSLSSIQSRRKKCMPKNHFWQPYVATGDYPRTAFPIGVPKNYSRTFIARVTVPYKKWSRVVPAQLFYDHVESASMYGDNKTIERYDDGIEILHVKDVTAYSWRSIRYHRCKHHKCKHHKCKKHPKKCPPKCKKKCPPGCVPPPPKPCPPNCPTTRPPPRPTTTRPRPTTTKPRPTTTRTKRTTTTKPRPTTTRTKRTTTTKPRPTTTRTKRTTTTKPRPTTTRTKRTTTTRPRPTTTTPICLEPEKPCDCKDKIKELCEKLRECCCFVEGGIGWDDDGASQIYMVGRVFDEGKIKIGRTVLRKSRKFGDEIGIYYTSGMISKSSNNDFDVLTYDCDRKSPKCLQLYRSMQEDSD